MSIAAPEATVEKRSTVRAKSLFRGLIHLNNRRTTLDCIIRNVSDQGARLDLANGHLAPERFDIVVPQKRRTYKAQLAWRADDRIGVRFIDSEAEPATEAIAEALRALQSQNDELRNTVRNLKARIKQVTGGDFEG